MKKRNFIESLKEAYLDEENKKKFKMIERKRHITDVQEEAENQILSDWIERNYGKKCPDYEKNCPCCKAWKCYDYLAMEG